MFILCSFCDEILFLLLFDPNIFFEFSIPRMGTRVDTILLIDNVIFVIEFKVGEKEFNSYGYNQVWDYALDLKNFHQKSEYPLDAADRWAAIQNGYWPSEQEIYDSLALYIKYDRSYAKKMAHLGTSYWQLGHRKSYSVEW